MKDKKILIHTYVREDGFSIKANDNSTAMLILKILKLQCLQ